MASLFQTLASLAAAGSVLLSASLEIAAPHQLGNTLLVNRDWHISEQYVPELRVSQVPGQLRQLTPEAADALEQLFAACKRETGAQLTSVSGYRSYDRQGRVYNNKLKQVNGSEEAADEYVARPGTSEHQTGLCIDIGQVGTNKAKRLGASFAGTVGGEWVRENGWRFGFILRYDQGWEEITGYSYEPWHIRYVGLENARRIHESPMPLETFLQLLRAERLAELMRYGSD